MTATVEQLQALAPEYASVDSDTLQTFLDTAAHYVNRSWWGEGKADIVQCWWAAHLMKAIGTDETGGTAGDVASETLGPLTVSYHDSSSSSSGDADDLGSTSYGRQIKLMMQTRKLQKGSWIIG